MDPNETLREIRSHVSVIKREGTPASTRATHGEWLAERVGQLDTWLSTGGFRPDAWVNEAAVDVMTALAGTQVPVTRPDGVEAIQRELNAQPTWREGSPCVLCDEVETSEDPIAHFVDDRNPSEYVMAHGQCGVDAGLRLA